MRTFHDGRDNCALLLHKRNAARLSPRERVTFLERCPAEWVTRHHFYALIPGAERS